MDIESGIPHDCMLCGGHTPSHWAVKIGNNLVARRVCGSHSLYECFKAGIWVRLSLEEEEVSRAAQSDL